MATVPALAADAGSWIPDGQKQDALAALIRQHRVPGVAIAIIEDGALAWHRAFGVTNIESGMLVTDTTLFQAASLTKPLFAYVVIKLVEEGRIGLGDRLADYYRPQGYPATDWSAAITVRHVLAHQTGLPNWRPAESEKELLQPKFVPGSAYAYSGEAYHWLQQVCETVSGLGLHELMTKYLLAPAGLTDMAMLWLPERDPREVYGHIAGERGEARLADLQIAREQGSRLQKVAARWGRPMTGWTFKDLEAAHAVMPPHTHPRLADRPLWRWNRPGSAAIDSASSLRTTARDYARFLSLMMPSNNRQPWQISDGSRRMMLTPQTERLEKPNLPAGLGWGLERWQGDIVYQHWGSNHSQFISMALADPRRRRGIVIMTNGAQGGPFIDKAGLLLTNTKYTSFT